MGTPKRSPRQSLKVSKKAVIESIECRALSQSGEEDFRGKDLWVLGTPTHYGTVPFRFSTLLKNALKEDHPNVKAAIFDTRMKDFPGARSSS